ncbi:MAG: hypothetical protein H3C50_04035 [Kiritimatiellae bacterium]|nr:hypothetical protein [Kiritimatiellia bacterium]MCO5062489.1 hypothetical protein [Kiritimatiellia bacterium]MCO5068353.1 hypothetical protein [Kiritimatiellia bacterium]
MIGSEGDEEFQSLDIRRDLRRAEADVDKLRCVSSGAIQIKEGPPEGVKSPTDVGTGKAKDKTDGSGLRPFRGAASSLYSRRRA